MVSLTATSSSSINSSSVSPLGWCVLSITSLIRPQLSPGFPAPLSLASFFQFLLFQNSSHCSDQNSLKGSLMLLILPHPTFIHQQLLLGFPSKHITINPSHHTHCCHPVQAPSFLTSTVPIASFLSDSCCSQLGSHSYLFKI